MRNLKDRYEFIIGFAAIVISLSAFKDELKGISLDYHWVSFNLSEYLFILIFSFILIIHLYAIPYIFNSTRYANYKIFKYIEYFGYFLFLLLILSPTLLSILFVFQFIIVQFLGLNEYVRSLVMSFISALTGIGVGFIAKSMVIKYQLLKRTKEEDKVIETEIKGFEIAQKLFEDGYYNQSLLEIFKVLEIGIYKILLQKDLVFRKGYFSDMLNVAMKYHVFSDMQIKEINNIKIKRNSIVHNTSSILTQADVQDAFKITKDILAISRDSEYGMKEGKFFLGKVLDNLEEARKLSKKQNKPMFIVVYDKNHQRLSQLDYSLGYFMEYKTTKRLVFDNFIQVLIDSEKPGIKDILPLEESLENCYLIILSPDDKLLVQESVYANPDEGLKRVKEFVARKNN